MNEGRVYLVGAGPGDPGLLTTRGAELIARADVLVFDRLAPAALLRRAPQDCELVDAGKRAGDHTLTQDEINALLVRHARAGRTVVRLKGGDPYVFGRGGEEAAACRGAGIPFEVVPGVTSAFAVPAAAGIPVTHRGVAHHVTAVTASAGPDGSDDPDYAWLAASSGTVVLLMGLRRTAHVAQQLIDAGAPAERPVAVISRGTTSAQRVVRGTLATIGELVEREQLASPALIVVGDVVDLADTLDWFSERPLFGTTITVTRARAQASELVRRLELLGATVIECPTIRIEPLPRKRLRAALTDPGQWGWVLLTSPNGVEAFFSELNAVGLDTRALHGIRFAAVGPASSHACRSRGVVPDVVPQRGTSMSLLERLRTEPLYGERVLLVRGEEGDERLPEGLRGAGAKVELVPVYRTVIDVPEVEVIKAALGSHLVTFTSASTVQNFARLVPEDVQPPPALTIGPVTTAAAREHGFEVVAEARDPSVAGLATAVADYVRQARADIEAAGPGSTPGASGARVALGGEGS